jgi:hypothetical protein
MLTVNDADAMGRACSSHLRDPRVDVRIILKLILKWGVKEWTEFNCLRIGSGYILT